MKLLIDIPEHIYEHAQELSEDSRDEGEAMRAIANGLRQESRSEIPNTCDDAISREAVIDRINQQRKHLIPELYSQDKIGDSAYRVCIDFVKRIPSVTPQPCGDAISRQAVLKIIDGWYDNNRDTENIEDLIVLITYMSSVTPQQRTGRWINAKVGKLFPSNDFKCSECGNILDFDGVNCGRGDANYCPNCGAKMEVEE